MSTKIGVRYEGNGYFRAVSRHAHEEAERRFTRGEVMNAEFRKPRSVGQNNLFHALCETAFDNQRDGPQFQSWRHLKSWLLIQAGECSEYRFEPGSLTKKVAAALRQQSETVDFVVNNATGEIVMRFAKSVSFDKMGHEGFTKVFDTCVDIICEEIVPGITREQLIAMAKKGMA